MTPHMESIDIIKRVCREHRIPYRVLMSDNRAVATVECRYAAIRAVHEAKPWMSGTQLADLFSRHHTTVYYALGNVKKRYGRGKPKWAVTSQFQNSTA